jgi:hypothetical protein
MRTPLSHNVSQTSISVNLLRKFLHARTGPKNAVGQLCNTMHDVNSEVLRPKSRDRQLWQVQQIKHKKR